MLCVFIAGIVGTVELATALEIAIQQKAINAAWRRIARSRQQLWQSMPPDPDESA